MFVAFAIDVMMMIEKDWAMRLSHKDKDKMTAQLVAI